MGVTKKFFMYFWHSKNAPEKAWFTIIIQYFIALHIVSLGRLTVSYRTKHSIRLDSGSRVFQTVAYDTIHYCHT